jgi:hypothetical protein
MIGIPIYTCALRAKGVGEDLVAPPYVRKAFGWFMVLLATRADHIIHIRFKFMQTEHT